MMMNCMGQGAAATLVGGLRIADWALALALLLIELLTVVAVVAIVRTLVALWRGRSAWRRTRRTGPLGPGEGTPT